MCIYKSLNLGSLHLMVKGSVRQVSTKSRFLYICYKMDKKASNTSLKYDRMRADINYFNPPTLILSRSTFLLKSAS